MKRVLELSVLGGARPQRIEVVIVSSIKEPKAVVNEIRSFCQRRDQVRSETTHQLSESYATCCRMANRRLQICDELLHKGLRTEAIQMAEEEPVLLELVSTLQFPELAAWEELAAAYAYAAPPRLLLQSAEALNRAYAEYESFKPVMKEHRRLALTRAGLDKRLGVLRKLVQMDANCIAWQDDLSAYEEVRQRQLRTDIDAAFNRGQDQQVRTHLHELITSPWRAPLSPTFLEPVIQQYYEVLARGLERCHKKGDVPQARQLIEEWSRVSSGAGIAPKPGLLRRVDLVRQMIDRNEQQQLAEFQFQSAIQELEKGIKEGCSRENLDELYQEVIRFGRPIPKSLVNSYNHYFQGLVRKDKRFETTIVFVTGGLVALIFLVFGIYLLMR